MALICAGLASALFALVAAWEMFGPFGAGHYAAAPAFGVAAENSLRWHQIGAVPAYYTLGPARPSEYYCHHPYGLFAVMALFVGVFGHHDWVVRAPAVLFSSFTPPLLYAAGRAAWGPVPGAVTALSFVLVPIALAFCNLTNLEVPTLFGVALALWGYLRFMQTCSRRHLGAALFGFVFALSIDWPGLLFTGAALGFFLVRGFIVPKLFPASDARAFGRLWAFLATLAVGVVGAHLYFFASAGRLGDFMASGNARSAGSNLPLRAVLDSRRYWLAISFTPLAIALGKLLLPWIAGRALLLRRELEALTLAVLFMAAVQYVVFKNGADVHIFWPQYFALYFALAMGTLAASLEGGLAPLLRRLRFATPRWAAYASLVSCALVPLAMARDAFAALAYARITGGRFDQHGQLLHPDKDKVAFIEWLSGRMGDDSGAILDAGMKQSFWVSWSLRHPVRTGPPPPAKPARGLERYFLLDSRFSDAPELERLSHAFAVSVVGPFWAVDRGVPPAPIQGFSVLRREPTLIERYTTSYFHALRQLVPDPYLTWEMRDHLDQTPNPAPSGPPDGDEQLRIAHNLAVSRGDDATARALLEKLLSGADRSVLTEYGDGSVLLGAKFQPGTSRVFTLYFLSPGPSDRDFSFSVRSRVVKALPLSMVPADSQERDVGLPCTLPRSLWKRGYVYSSITEILERPGTEEFYGRWAGPHAPRATHRHEPVTLLRL